MEKFDLRLFTLSATVFTALVCMLIIILDIFNGKRSQGRLKLYLVLYFASHVITGIGFMLYFYSSTIFIWANWLFMLCIVSLPVFLYAFIFEITKINLAEQFSKLHYLVPVMLSVIMLILSLVVPEQVQLAIIKGNGAYVGGSKMFYIFSNKLYFRLGFNLLYVALSFRRLPRYRKFITSYSANESKASLRWVTILLFFIVSLIFVPLYGIFVSRSGLASSFVTYFQVSLLIVQYGFLVFHVIKQSYVLLEVVKINENPVQVLDELKVTDKTEINVLLKKSVLNSEVLEEYIKTKKPFLRPNLKITDIAEELMINRTYISAFINSEYNMNFSTYINQLRYDEYQRVRNNEAYNNVSNAELADKVGFGSYRSYTRFALNIETNN